MESPQPIPGVRGRRCRRSRLPSQRDYALARREQAAAGDADELARATYAVYNGGPGHLNRYRQPKERADLREIDRSFLEKYLAVKEGKELEVGKCFSGAGSLR
ncbi:MAG: hypothetical protein AW07_03950 [Candidatus Accumulibacter sp. SK-11]|nr:MAG: hypothetical protein AW07_03950 [Candidatus Accumulibacter sp. SK-11]